MEKNYLSQEGTLAQTQKRVAIYASASNTGGVGINYQVAICREYAKQQGWTLAEDHVFIDKGRASFDRRSGLRSLLTTVRHTGHPVDIVLVGDGKRLSSSPLEMVSVVNAVRCVGVDVRIAYAEPARPLPGDLNHLGELTPE